MAATAANAEEFAQSKIFKMQYAFLGVFFFSL